MCSPSRTRRPSMDRSGPSPRRSSFRKIPTPPPDEDSQPYSLARSYYLSRAYRPDFAWDWGSNNLHQEEYAELIRDSDEASRRSTGMIGLILANHLLSAVDALVSGRLGIAGETEPSLQFLMVPGPYESRSFGFQLRLPVPRNHDF